MKYKLSFDNLLKLQYMGRKDLSNELILKIDRAYNKSHTWFFTPCNLDLTREELMQILDKLNYLINENHNSVNTTAEYLKVLNKLTARAIHKEITFKIGDSTYKAKVKKTIHFQFVTKEDK